MARALEGGKVRCEQCGNEYERIGSHWSRGQTCNHPEIHPYWEEIITGLMMGDGSLSARGSNPQFRVSMISPNYLEYLNDIFGWMTTGVSLMKTADECERQSKESGFVDKSSSYNYSDVYRLCSRSHPDLHRFDWYTSGDKVWPSEIDLTPTVLTHWYVGDGCWDNGGSRSQLKISMSNEASYTKKVSRMFRRVGLPDPTYTTAENQNGFLICDARWTVEESHELWDYMESPPPDFHYKFPEEYHTP